MSDLDLNYIQNLCQKGNIKWTAHVLARLQQRDISTKDVKNCIMTGEIIETYPTDYPYPSCLILGICINNVKLHCVVGVGEEYLWFITAYKPSLEKWDKDFKTRKAENL
ncbi:MAG: hypothetical protein ATN35_10205 [Epulopiscium sp. Nele67-Bin004]|nr:MAG: hypothetical protein ATN35_10205 [Epulopiscium sp. Nele67-Bin004]